MGEHHREERQIPQQEERRPKPRRAAAPRERVGERRQVTPTEGPVFERVDERAEEPEFHLGAGPSVERLDADIRETEVIRPSCLLT